MRLLVTGVDAAGHSCAAHDGPLALQGGDGLEGILYAVLYATPSLPSISTGGGRVADVLDLTVPTGAMRWTVIDYAPGAAFSMHHTDTVDLDVVLSGSVDLILMTVSTRSRPATAWWSRASTTPGAQGRKGAGSAS